MTILGIVSIVLARTIVTDECHVRGVRYQRHDLKCRLLYCMIRLAEKC